MLEIWKISMRGGLRKPRRGVTTQPGAAPLVHGSCSGKRPYGPSGRTYGRPIGAQHPQALAVMPRCGVHGCRTCDQGQRPWLGCVTPSGYRLNFLADTNNNELANLTFLFIKNAGTAALLYRAALLFLYKRDARARKSEKGLAKSEEIRNFARTNEKISKCEN